MLTWFLSWVLDTVKTSAEAEMNDDSALRDQLLEAEMRREMGEISDEEFAEIETDLLGRIRDIKERREGGSGPLEFGGGEPLEASPDSRFQIEATVSGDFHDPASAPHTTIVETEPDREEQIQVLDIEPGDPLTARADRAAPSGPSHPARALAGSADRTRSRKPSSRVASRRRSRSRSR
jgi:hypothetical protein